MTAPTTTAMPSRISPPPATLAKATAGAAIAAAVIATLFVLPAEYGIDPTGFGTAIGLTGMVSGEAEEAAPAATVATAAPTSDIAAPTKANISKSTPWRQDEMTITLEPHSGQEVKAHMVKGDSFVFQWASTGGPVKAEMHGEATGATDGSFTDYWKDLEITGGQGDFTAPFDGTHGWYFRNKGETPITVKVKTVGFYKDLFKPKAE